MTKKYLGRWNWASTLTKMLSGTGAKLPLLLRVYTLPTLFRAILVCALCGLIKYFWALIRIEAFDSYILSWWVGVQCCAVSKRDNVEMTWTRHGLGIAWDLSRLLAATFTQRSLIWLRICQKPAASWLYQPTSSSATEDDPANVQWVPLAGLATSFCPDLTVLSESGPNRAV